MKAVDAERQLSARFDRFWTQSTLERVSLLPDHVAKAGFELLLDDGDGESAGQQIDALSGSARLSLFTALLPGLGECVTRWWVEQQSSPQNDPEQCADFLRLLAKSLGPYNPTPVWAASWVSHVSTLNSYFQARSLGLLFAAAADGGHPYSSEVAATIEAIAKGLHPVATASLYALHALASSIRQSGWITLQDLLVGAQREDGLRSAVLEAARSGQPGCQAIILDTIVEHDLLRFRSVTNYIENWIGIPAASAATYPLPKSIQTMANALRSAQNRSLLIDSNDLMSAFLAMRAAASVDIEECFVLARTALRSSDPNLRMEALQYLLLSDTQEGFDLLIEALRDSDPRVAAVALECLSFSSQTECSSEHWIVLTDYVRSLSSVPAKLEPIGIGGTRPSPSCEDGFWVLFYLRHTRQLTTLLPLLKCLSSRSLCNFLYVIAEPEIGEPAVQAAVLSFFTHRNKAVRDQAAITAGRFMRTQESHAD